MILLGSVLVLVSVVAGVSLLAGRSRWSSPTRSSGSGPPIAPMTLDDQARAQIVAAARRVLDGAAPPAPLPDSSATGRRLAVVSLSRADAPAVVATSCDSSLAEALRRALADVRARSTDAERSAGRIKVDIATGVLGHGAFDADAIVDVDKGLWFPDDELLLLPEELSSARLVLLTGRLDRERLSRYIEETRRPESDSLDETPRVGSAYYTLEFDSFVEGDNGGVTRLFRGSVLEPDGSPDSLLAACRAGGDYLLRHQHASGRFDYIFSPSTGTTSTTYNLLRHAGTCYSLAELYGAAQDERYLAGARLGIEALLATSRPPRTEDQGTEFEAVVSSHETAKLGASALAVLAIERYHGVCGDDAWLPRARKLGLFLLFQQQPDGRFFAKYFYGEPRQAPRVSLIYSGESILALTRLYHLDGDRRWLEAAERGARWMLDAHGGGVDLGELATVQWLVMALDELDRITAKPVYAAQARRLAGLILDTQRHAPDPPDLLGSMSTPPASAPTATRSEALVAMCRMARRGRFDAAPYVDALHLATAFQLRSQITEATALYFARPRLAIGGFRRSVTNPSVRIDYVQHNISALLGLRAIGESDKGISGAR